MILSRPEGVKERFGRFFKRYGRDLVQISVDIRPRIIILKSLKNHRNNTDKKIMRHG
jgi:hypothetical protein